MITPPEGTEVGDLFHDAGGRMYRLVRESDGNIVALPTRYRISARDMRAARRATTPPMDWRELAGRLSRRLTWRVQIALFVAALALVFLAIEAPLLVFAMFVLTVVIGLPIANRRLERRAR